MKRDEVFRKVQLIIVDKAGLDVEEVTEGANLSDDLGFDSLDEIEFIMEIEAEFDISVNYNDIEKIKTVSEVVDYLEGVL